MKSSEIFGDFIFFVLSLYYKEGTITNNNYGKETTFSR
jgi:hypothetical protein